MKKILLLVIAIALIAWGLQNFSDFKAIDYAKNAWQKIDWSKITALFNSKSAPDPEKQLNIFIRDDKFIPNLNAVRSGIKVTWINEDDKNHTVTGASWGSAEIMPGKAWSKTFDVAGDYTYHCSLHPSETGEIIVK